MLSVMPLHPELVENGRWLHPDPGFDQAQYQAKMKAIVRWAGFDLVLRALKRIVTATTPDVIMFGRDGPLRRAIRLCPGLAHEALIGSPMSEKWFSQGYK